MKRCLLFCYLILSCLFAVHAADVTYVFAEAAKEQGIILNTTWTSDSIDEYSYWQTKKASYGHSRYVEEGLFIYKNGKFNVYSNRKIKEVILTFDNKAIIQNPNDTILTWNIEEKGTLSKLEITYVTEEQDSIVDTPTKMQASLEWSMDTCEVVLEEENIYPALTTNMPNTDGVEYTSSNTEVATIDKTGNITLLSAGMSIISASFAGNTDYEAAEPAIYVLIAIEPPLGEEYQGVWTLVTDMSQLSIGSKIIIAAASANKALSTLQNPKNRASVDIIKSTNKDTLMVNRDVQIITLELGAKERTWALSVGDMGYLYAASSSENQMKTQSQIDANASWVIILSDTGMATMQAMGNNTHCFMKYNAGYQTFSCFEEDGANVVLYGKDLSSVSTAIIESEIKPSSIKKAIRNHQIVIMRDGIWYSLLGQPINE
jgi:hypothetical protein